MRIVFVLLVVLSITSCTNYGLGNFSNETTLLHKPSYRGDSISKSNYISASFNKSFHNDNYDEYSSILIGDAQFHRALTKKYMNFAYGGFLYYGNYNAFDYKTIKGGNLSFYGVGATTEINFNIPTERFDIRLIGAKMTLFTENGGYSKFKDAIQDFQVSEDDYLYSGADVNSSDVGISIAATSELVYKGRNYDAGCSLVLSFGSSIVSAGSKLFYSQNGVTVFLKSNHSIYGTYRGLGLSYRLK